MKAFRIRHIATRFALMLAGAAVLPLVAYGLWSLVTLQRGTRESIVTGNLNVASRAADEIGRYILGNAAILRALAADLQNTGLEQWQQDRILKDYVLEFREFRELTLFDEAGGVIATSRIGTPRVALQTNLAPVIEGVSMSPIHVDQDLLPTSVFAVRLKRLNQPAGWLIGEFSLEEMWRMVDQIRLGAHGFALVVSPDRTLIAHGDPDRKTLVAQSRRMTSHPLVADPGGSAWREYVDEDGHQQLAVSAPIPTLRWTVIVEQPTNEAYANAAALQHQLRIAILAALLVMMLAGLLFGRRFIIPIFSLQRATKSIAEGNLETRVTIDTADEFGQLGEAFNGMAAQLGQLQEDVKRQERQAMFGRIAAGLFHDLAHPIQNIGNSARLMSRDDVDAESRTLFHRTIEREITTLKHFMDDLRNIAKPRPVERFPMDVNTLAAEILEAQRPEYEKHEIALEGRYGEGQLIIDGDRFALGRVIRNLITNAMQATAAGGAVTLTTARAGNRIVVVVTDSGSGIPADRLGAIFDDFVTTKRRGLGLGLAISKRIVEQLDGTIAVQSEVGRGTAFTLSFPAGRSEQAIEAAS